MKTPSKAVLPFAIIGGTIAVVAALRLFSSVPPPVVRSDFAPLVITQVATPRPFQFVVRAHGSVSPRTESDLIPQVSGEVVEVSDALAAGGFFEEGEVLLRIERTDYEASLETARASFARAGSEHTRAEKERDRQRSLADRSVTSQARIDDAETAFRVAFASLREARARLGQAERDLDRTEIRAPYAGRVRTKSVDVGQFVQRGAPIATLYAVDFAEVRLPLPDRELAFLDLPLVPEASRRRAKPLPALAVEKGDTVASVEDAALEAPKAATAVSAHDIHEARPLPSVVLHAEFAGRSHTWNGAIVRTEGEIDAQTRMVHVVAQVRDPYGVDPSNAGAPPLAVGLFVEAEIMGFTVPEAYVLPRIALRGDSSGSKVYLVDSDGRLHFREVEVLRIERETFVVGAGLSPGDRVCVSALAAAVEGMSVRERPEISSVAEITP